MDLCPQTLVIAAFWAKKKALDNMVNSDVKFKVQNHKI